MEQATIIEQITQLEAERDKLGWDQEAELLVLLRGGPLHLPQAAPLPLPPDRKPLTALARLVREVGRQHLRFPRGDEPYAVLLMAEGYGKDMTPEEQAEYEAHAPSQRLPLGDRPDAYEIRFVAAVDTGGNRYSLQRIRGEDPEPVEVDTATDRDNVTPLLVALMGLIRSGRKPTPN